MRELSIPTSLPAFLEVERDGFVSSATATTAQWRAAASNLRAMPLTEAARRAVLRPVRQMLRIADTFGIAEDAPLLPAMKARGASNVTNLPKRR